ncbi:hypothetical protein [Pedobacter deserti]|uniref:hypothetical protein n=1 Tax=Pedobacter deserti TaxID=2817382 RepID=UPI00210E2A74|nr:hypothetical protein [Pedobacter sp. SYSU D00382]
MVLQSFSWLHFLIAAVLLSLVWYLVVWLMFFRRRPAGAGAVSPAESLPHGWQDRVDVLEDGLVGKPVPDPGVSLVAADEFGFGGPGKDLQLGVLADVQEEIKSACRDLEYSVGTKEDFYERFALIRGRYAIPAGSRQALNEFIREHVPFYLSEDELEHLWL